MGTHGVLNAEWAAHVRLERTTMAKEKRLFGGGRVSETANAGARQKRSKQLRRRPPPQTGVGRADRRHLRAATTLSRAGGEPVEGRRTGTGPAEGGGTEWAPRQADRRPPESPQTKITKRTGPPRDTPPDIDSHRRRTHAFGVIQINVIN